MNATSLIVLCACLPLSAVADIYRWHDADGVIHFSERPPTQGAYRNVTPPASALRSPGPPIRPRADALIANGDLKPALHPSTLQARADGAERCAKARERVSFLEEKTAHRLFRTGDDGQPARLTDEEFAVELSDASSAAAKYCR